MNEILSKTWNSHVKSLEGIDLIKIKNNHKLFIINVKIDIQGSFMAVSPFSKTIAVMIHNTTGGYQKHGIFIMQNRNNN